MVASLERRAGLRRAEQQQARAGARAQLEAGVLARRRAQGDHVRAQGLAAVDGRRRLLGRDDRRDVRHGLDVENLVARGMGLVHVGLVGGVGVAQRQAHHEPVELGLRAAG